MFSIILFLTCIFIVLISFVGLFIQKIRALSLLLLLGSLTTAIAVAVWVYYPRSFERNYLNSPPIKLSLAHHASKKNLQLGTAVRNMDQLNDGQYSLLYNSITPENALKLEGVLSDLNTQSYDFKFADTMVDEALRLGLNVRGHALVFGKASDLFKAPDLDAWLQQYPTEKRPEILTRFMKKHIQTMIKHYQGRIITWDVVNEVLDLFGNGKAEENVFYRYIGANYVNLALTTARETDKDIKIILNEQLNNYTDARAEAFFKFIQSIVEQGIPLDGIGLQAHSLYSLAAPHTLKKYMQRFENLGLTIEITELEARLKLFESYDDPYLAQGEYYRDIAQQCLDVKACIGISIWGYSDEISWMDDIPYLFPKPNEPYLLDKDRKPKPAVRLLQNLFSESKP